MIIVLYSIKQPHFSHLDPLLRKKAHSLQIVSLCSDTFFRSVQIVFNTGIIIFVFQALFQLNDMRCVACYNHPSFQRFVLLTVVI